MSAEPAPTPRRDGEAAAVPEIYAAVAAVAAALGRVGIAHDGVNAHGSYAFHSKDGLRRGLAPHLCAEQVFYVPHLVSHTVETRSSRKGGEVQHSTVVVDWRLVSGRDGSEIVARAPGEGMDFGDKSLAKAVTASFKTMATNVFNVATSGFDDDPDATSPEDEAARRGASPSSALRTCTEAQAAKMVERVRAGEDPRDLAAKAEEHGFYLTQAQALALHRATRRGTPERNGPADNFHRAPATASAKTASGS